MPTLWAHTAEYTSISVGDDLPILVKFEFRPPIEDGVDAPQEIPVDTEKLAALVKELLFKAFPPDNVDSEETAIDIESFTEFLPGDTVGVFGQVVGKSDGGGKRQVECAVTVESQEGALLANATALVSF
ncbi:MAG: hypothetical protein VX664_01215 [Chloroflexota bacterium]|uniref:N-terminal of MaoC-like dehydratase domain-containing protein n=1 Tax=marine metagenome TaxID=408172 RepID=A0A381N728_9ZZZZ|nr:hypothetical protein [Chloroflexota bacterium]